MTDCTPNCSTMLFSVRGSVRASAIRMGTGTTVGNSISGGVNGTIVGANWSWVSGAHITGAINAGGCAGSWTVQFGPDSSYGAGRGYDSQSSSYDAGAGSSDVPVSTTIGGLPPDTTYHYRITGANNCSCALGMFAKRPI